MKSITLTEAKARLSEVLRRVRRGESVLILYRGNPVARLEPVGAEHGRDEDRLRDLERRGVIRRGRRRPDPRLLSVPLPRPAKGGSVLEALLEERREGR